MASTIECCSSETPRTSPTLRLLTSSLARSLLPTQKSPIPALTTFCILQVYFYLRFHFEELVKCLLRKLTKKVEPFFDAGSETLFVAEFNSFRFDNNEDS